MRRHTSQVLAQELQELKCRRAESKARSRALSQQEPQEKTDKASAGARRARAIVVTLLQLLS